MNKVLLIGRLGKNPELKKVKGDLSICTFSLATSTTFTNKDGQKVEKTEWHRIKAFGPIADVAGKYLASGRLVHIDGRNETSNYTDKDGVKRYSTEVICEKIEFLGAAPTKKADATVDSQVMDDEPVTFTGDEQPVTEDPAPF